MVAAADLSLTFCKDILFGHVEVDIRQTVGFEDSSCGHKAFRIHLYLGCDSVNLGKSEQLVGKEANGASSTSVGQMAAELFSSPDNVVVINEVVCHVALDNRVGFGFDLFFIFRKQFWGNLGLVVLPAFINQTKILDIFLLLRPIWVEREQLQAVVKDIALVLLYFEETVRPTDCLRDLIFCQDTLITEPLDSGVAIRVIHEPFFLIVVSLALFLGKEKVGTKLCAVRFDVMAVATHNNRCGNLFSQIQNVTVQLFLPLRGVVLHLKHEVLAVFVVQLLPKSFKPLFFFAEILPSGNTGGCNPNVARRKQVEKLFIQSRLVVETILVRLTENLVNPFATVFILRANPNVAVGTVFFVTIPDPVSLSGEEKLQTVLFCEVMAFDISPLPTMLTARQNGMPELDRTLGVILVGHD